MGDTVDIGWWKEWGKGQVTEDAPSAPPEHLDDLYEAFKASEHAQGDQLFDVRLGAFLDATGCRPGSARAVELLASQMWLRLQSERSRRLTYGPHQPQPDPAQ